ncbi:trifunctional histidinol dehydrogenase [Recurvomyces mirabilis]|nr:trifunctional histidinol dehydrogenase [Recurvomyces mirabilis]
MPPKQRQTDQPTRDRRLFLTIELKTRRARAEAAQQPFDQDAENERMGLIWDSLKERDKTLLAAQYRKYLGAVTTAQAVIEQADGALAQEPRLLGSEAGGWRHDDSCPAEDMTILQTRLGAFRQARAETKPMKEEMEILVATLQDFVPEYEDLGSSLQWAEEEVATLRQKLRSWRQAVDRHSEATWDASRRVLLGSDAGTWVGGWRVGAGNFGAADVWVQGSGAGAIKDRLIIKDSRAPPLPHPNSMTWWEDHELNWSLDPRDPTRLLPNEIVVMSALRSRIGGENIVFLRSFRLVEEERRMLMYLEFCEHGDLEQWSCWYDRATYLEKGETAWSEGKWRAFHRDREAMLTKRGLLPEPFLWHVFATAGLLLDKVELESNPVSDFTTILHLDLKTPNIFVGTNNSDRFRGYPLPKLGDFGLCWTPANGPHGLKNQKRCGSPFNKPPEQHLAGKDDNMPAMDSKPNVWGVGNLMWSLIEQETGDHRVKWETTQPRNDYDPDTLNEPTFRELSMTRYSVYLRGLIQRCPSYNSAQRPDFEAVLRTIRKHYGANPVLRNLRSRGEDDPAFAPDSANSIKAFMRTGETWKWARLGAPVDDAPKPRAAGGQRDLRRVPPLQFDQDGGDQDQPPGGVPGPGVKALQPQRRPRSQPSTTVPPLNGSSNTGERPPEFPRGLPADPPTDPLSRNPTAPTATGLGTPKSRGPGVVAADPAVASRRPKLKLWGPRAPTAGPSKSALADADADEGHEVETPAQTTTVEQCKCRCKQKASCLHRCCKRHLDGYVRGGSQQMVDDVKKAKKTQGGKARGKTGGNTVAKGKVPGKRTSRGKVDESGGQANGGESQVDEIEEEEVDGATIARAVVGSRKRKPAPDDAGPARRKIPRRG